MGDPSADFLGLRPPVSYLVAAYGESLFRTLGLVISGIFFTLKPDVWPGLWAWVIIGPLLVLNLAQPLYTLSAFRLRTSPTTVTTITGILSTRTRSAEWTSITAVDWKAPWAFRLVGLAQAELSQSGDGSARFLIPAIRLQERQVLEQLWEAAQQPSGLARMPVEDAEDDTILYESTIRDLAIASTVYGQFAAAGGALALAASDLLGNLGVTAVADAANSVPALSAIATTAVIIAAGLVITVARMYGFAVRRSSAGEVTISYGFINRQVRSIGAMSVIGTLSKRNLVEMLLGRVRVTLLTRDSAMGIGSNLVLPSLPHDVVSRVLGEAFDESTEATYQRIGRTRAFATSLISLICVVVPPVVLHLFLRQDAGTTPYVAVLLPGLVVIVTLVVGSLLSARLALDPSGLAIVASSRFVSERQWNITVSSVHVVTACAIRKRLRFVALHYFAGRPRALRFVRFAPGDISQLQQRVVASAGVLPQRHTTSPSEAK